MTQKNLLTTKKRNDIMDSSIRFPRYLYYGTENMITVLGYLGYIEGDYTKNRGYVDPETNKIYVYKPKVEGVPSFKVTKDGDIEKTESFNRMYTSIFVLDKTYENSVSTIIQATPKDRELYNEEALADMNAATSIFVPEINDSDDPLKKLIKTAIIRKGVDINKYKCRLPEKYALTNLKSALVGKTKMSINVFMLWCDLLEVHFEVSLTDNGNDTVDPLPDPVVYSTRVGKILG